MQRSVSSIRNLLAGFAGLLLLMGGLAVDATLQTRNVSAASTALRKESRDRDALLDQLRNDTHRSATLARDYILERDEVLAVKQETELQQLQANDARILQRYSERAPENEKDAIRNLQRISDAYWTSLAPALNWEGLARTWFNLHDRSATLTNDRWTLRKSAYRLFRPDSSGV
jgi:CHASE3 domain sensor protein